MTGHEKQADAEAQPVVSTELEPNPDFEALLDVAFASPKHITLKGSPGISPEELKEREQYHSPHASAPENIPRKSYDRRHQAYEASTEDPSLYPLLLAQAMRRLEITKGNADPGLEVTTQLEKTARHETEHGRMAHAFGVGSRFGVSILHDPNEDIWALGPFHALVGDTAGTIMLTRLQEAAIAVAPEDPSAADMHTVRSLGYSSREEVLERLLQAYPDLNLEY